MVLASRMSYYVAIGCILFAAWFFTGAKQCPGVPFYKVGRTKWYYDAENLVKDSYTKVGLPEARNA